MQPASASGIQNRWVTHVDLVATLDQPESISFIPSRVDGLDDVSLVTIERTRLTFRSGKIQRRYAFADIGRPQVSWLGQLLRHVTFRKPWPLMIGERDWFHAPPNRFIRFYTDPLITVFMPADDVREYAPSVFCRMQSVWRAGGYETWDLG